MATESATSKTAIPQRNEIAEQHTWRLSDIYPSDAAWEADYAKAQQLLEKAKEFAGKLASSPAVMYDCFESRSTLSLILHSLYQYAYLNKDLDNRVSKWQAFTERVAMLSSQVAAAFSFVEPELLKMPDEKLLAMEAQFPKRGIYDFYLKELVRSKAHVRNEEVEEVLAMSSVMARGADNIFSMLDDADITYPIVKGEDGQEIKLTKQRYAKLIECKDRTVRRDAHNAFYQPYKEHVNTLGASLSASVSRDIFYSRVRRYGNCLESALDGNNIPLSVYHSLLDTTEANLPGMHAYTALRKRIFKIDNVYTYDMANPLFPEQNYEVPYDRAVERLLEAVGPLGGKYVSVLRDAMRSRWVDVYETEGKGGGAYSWGNYSIHPYVLMNYNDTVDNMFTLAHEMGHAMHSYLSNTTQPFPKSHYAIFIAEIASTLNEGLLWNLLIKEATDIRVKLDLYNRYLDMTFGTFFNQVMYARFELLIHDHVEQGNALSPEYFNQVWGDLTKKYYGPAFTLDELTALKWSRIPHFYNSFYVYQYATSYAASQAILQKFLNGEPGIIDRYLEMLSSGGKDYPIELVKICGIDMTTPEPFLATINRFAQHVAEVDQLTRDL